jgi:RNA polymerase sigma-70 factor (ECF subfamily)
VATDALNTLAAAVAAPGAMTTDEQLMLAFQRGSREAFAELFARYRGPVFGYFRRRLDHPARAEELAQETFIAVLNAAVRYEPRATFRSYLYGIAMKQLSAERRKEHTRQQHSAGVIAPEAPDSPGSSEAMVKDSANPAAQDAEEVLWVRRALGQLEDGDREILMLREYEGLRYEEIAALLRIPLNTVRSRLFRARMALRDLLRPPTRIAAEGRRP